MSIKLSEFVKHYDGEASDMKIILDFISANNIESEAIGLISKLCESKIHKLSRELEVKSSYLCFLSPMDFDECVTFQELLGTIRFWALGNYEFDDSRSALRKSMLNALKRQGLTIPDLMFCDDKILWDWLRREFPDKVTDEVWKEKTSKLGYFSTVVNGW